jgi:hypothetical protein
VSSLKANSPTSRLVAAASPVVPIEAGEQREHLLPDFMAWSTGMHGLVEALGRRGDGAPRGRLLGDSGDEPAGSARLEQVPG